MSSSDEKTQELLTELAQYMPFEISGGFLPPDIKYKIPSELQALLPTGYDRLVSYRCAKYIPVENTRYVDILAVFSYGSLNYGTTHKYSDRDYIVIADTRQAVYQVIVPGKASEKEGELPGQDINMNIYSLDYFQNMLRDNNIEFIEAYFHPLFCSGEVKLEFKLNASELRKTVFKKSDNSYAKAGKKLDVERQPFIAKKSLFHSYRMLVNARDLCKSKGKNIDWKSCIEMYDEIMNLDDKVGWKTWKGIYQERFNKLKTEIRGLAPLEPKSEFDELFNYGSTVKIW